MKSKGRIYLVDDDSLIVSTLSRYLERSGYELKTSSDAEMLEAQVASFSPDVIILDIGLPGRSGLDALKGLRRTGSEIPVVMVTADDTIETAVQAMKKGATDYLTKPFDRERLKLTIDHLLERENLQRKVDYLTRMSSSIFEEEFVGESPAIKYLKEQAEKLAGTKVSTILITGESGTGKEVVAKHIHNRIHSDKKKGETPFVTVNCTALPDSLIESELFGHVKGAFTDAKEEQRGVFELASGGSLLLDEIGEMRPDLQSKLLRVLEEGSVRRIGGRSNIPIDVTVIATTNVQMSKSVREGRFREDLFYRLSTFEFHIPPLRDRVEDIMPLAAYFAKFYSDSYKKPSIKGFSPEAGKLLVQYTWPGNVRELRNTMERIVVLGSSDMVKPEHLPRELSSDGGIAEPMNAYRIRLPEEGVSLDDVEKELIVQALKRSGNNRAKAAKLLSLGYDALRYKIGKYGLE
ncbi:MAG: sigma-54 dependent transcriptional regulator [Pseudomonadota bacterium]|jgi:DNA-binding NtrC family response regulator